MKRYIFLMIIFIAVELSAQGVGSVGASDSRTSAMGNTYTAISRGVYALDKNPANLALTDNTVEIATVFPLPNLNFNVGADFLNFDDLNYFFGGVSGPGGTVVGRTLDDADKLKFLGMFDNGNQINTNFNIRFFSASVNISPEIGAFGFSMGDRIAFNAGVPVGLFDLAMHGNTPDKEYAINDLQMSMSYLRDMSFTYSRELTDLLPDMQLDSYLKRLSVGVTVKYIQGFAYSEVDRINTKITTLSPNNAIRIDNDIQYNIAVSTDFGIVWDFLPDGTERESNIGPFPAPAGTGMGFDFGISGEIDDVWSFGLSLTDMGSVSWSEETVTYKSSSSSLIDDVRRDTSILNTLGDTLKGTGAYSSGFDTDLPSAFRAGVGFRLDRFLDGNFPGTMLIAFDYNQGFNDQPSNSTDPRVSLGIEWKPMDWIPIRTGFSAGGAYGFQWGAGIGLDAGFLEFNFASSFFNAVMQGNSVNRVGLSLGTRWKF